MFTSGGSEANDSAFKTARYYWKRKGKPGKYKVIARKGSYHGVTLAATFATGLEKYHSMFGPAMDGFVHIPAPNPYRYEGILKDGEIVYTRIMNTYSIAVEMYIFKEKQDEFLIIGFE